MTAVRGLWFDFAGTGFGGTAHDDCTTLLRSITYQRGGTAELTGAAQGGTCTIRMLNPDGLFDPDDAAGPLHGLLLDGVRVWFGANEDGTLSGAGTVRGRFAGRVLDWAPVPAAGAGTSTPEVEVTCEDALGWYARTPVALSVDCSPTVTGACTAYTMDGSAITDTAAGFRWYLSHYGSSGDNVQRDPEGLTIYTGSTGPGVIRRRPDPLVTTPGQGGGGWYFRNYGAVDAAMPEGHYDGGDADATADPYRIIIFTVGRGTLRVWLHDGGNTPTWTLSGIDQPYPALPALDVWTVLASGASVAFPYFDVAISDTTHCLHALQVTRDNNQTGYGGFDWTPA